MDKSKVPRFIWPTVSKGYLLVEEQQKMHSLFIYNYL